MEEDLTFVASVPRGEGYVALSRSAQGQVFKKHILTKGKLRYKDEIIDIDDNFINTMIRNFENEVCDIVQIPLANDNNDHVENPAANLGEVIGLSFENDKLYAIQDFRKHQEDVGKTILGASAFFSKNYKDTSTGQYMGPTLLHVAATNRPYVTKLDGFEQIVAASNSNKSNTVFLTAVTQEKNEMGTLEEILAALKDEHGIDVADLQARVAAGDATTALSNTLKDALTNSGIVKLSNGDAVNADDIVGAVAQIADDNVALSARLKDLETDKQRAEVRALVSSGHILPAQEEAMLEVKLTNSELFDKLIPAEPIVKLSNELGVLTQPQSVSEKLDESIERYFKLSNELGYSKNAS